MPLSKGVGISSRVSKVYGLTTRPRAGRARSSRRAAARASRASRLCVGRIADGADDDLLRRRRHFALDRRRAGAACSGGRRRRARRRASGRRCRRRVPRRRQECCAGRGSPTLVVPVKTVPSLPFCRPIENLRAEAARQRFVVPDVDVVDGRPVGAGMQVEVHVDLVEEFAGDGASASCCV